MWFTARILCVGAGGASNFGSALEPCCYEMIRARSLDEGLTLARNSFFDLYLIRQRTFESSGRKFCRKVRSFDQNTPILLSVESTDRLENQMIKQAGDQECIHESAEAWELEQAIVRLISQAESKRRERLRTALSSAPRQERSENHRVLRTVA